MERAIGEVLLSEVSLITGNRIVADVSDVRFPPGWLPGPDNFAIDLHQDNYEVKWED